jgi:septation ring formation regulator EzrA
MSAISASKKVESRIMNLTAQKISDGTTTEKIKSEERRKKSEEKIITLKKALSERKDIKRDSFIRLKGELILSEKALLDSEKSGSGGNDVEASEHVERAETKIKDVESHLEDGGESQ